MYNKRQPRPPPEYFEETKSGVRKIKLLYAWSFRYKEKHIGAFLRTRMLIYTSEHEEFYHIKNLFMQIHHRAVVCV